MTDMNDALDPRTYSWIGEGISDGWDSDATELDKMIPTNSIAIWQQVEHDGAEMFLMPLLKEKTSYFAI